MKRFQSSLFQFRLKAIGSTILVIVAMAALMLGTRSGIISLVQLQRFWPLTLVAVGLLDLFPGRKRRTPEHGLRETRQEYGRRI